MNKIYFFSGTGNSIAIAKAISEQLGDTELIPMATASAEQLDVSKSERVGMVFPVYGWGMPRLVAEFSRRLKPTQEQYVFAITTCGGTPGNTLQQLGKTLNQSGSKLNAGFAVSGDFLISLQGSNEMAIIRFMSWLGRKTTPAVASKRLPEILRSIEGKQTHAIERSNTSVNVIGSMMYGMSMKMFKTMDKNFSATDDCVSCGTCVKVCPRENVRLKDGKPTWHQDCEFCYACLAWCPKQAIQFAGNPLKGAATHPDAVLSDALLR